MPEGRELAALGVFAIFGLVLYGIYEGVQYLRRRREQAHRQERFGEEIPFRMLTLGRILGEGSYGKVHKGTLRTGENRTLVAIKVLRNLNMTLEEFQQEAAVMKNLRHENVVRYYGVSTSPSQVFHIVMELMEKGSLIKFLHGEGHDLEYRELLKISLCCASGMEYLAFKKIIHRDLAARNVLMADNNIAKITDFGLARRPDEDGSIYTANPGCPYPMCWTAPEGIEMKTFSIQSDVWSFGVLLYEIFSNGAVPFVGFEPHDVLGHLKGGYRLQKPDNCSGEVYQIMTDCWNMDRRQRPTFSQLLERITELYI